MNVRNVKESEIFPSGYTLGREEVPRNEFYEVLLVAIAKGKDM